MNQPSPYITRDAEAEVGQLFTRNGEDVYELISYCDRPSVKLKDIRTGEVIHVPVGTPRSEEFIRLLPALSPQQNPLT